jgi:trigger factor
VNETVRETGQFERLVTMELTNAEIDTAKASAARRLSKDIRIPGFRPGKAPRPVVEAAIGAARLRSEAIEELIPIRLGSVLEEADLSPAVTPTLEKVDDIDGGVAVEVRITLWPTLEDPPPFRDREIEVEPPILTDEDLDAAVTRMREQFARLETVDRSAGDGDFVSVDITVEEDGEPVAEASASELLYEIGSGLLVEGIDDRLQGRSSGEVVTFQAPLPSGFGDRAGQKVSFTVKVNEVKAKILPDLDDDWVTEVTEFETVGELRDALESRLTDVRRRAAASQFREKALDLLVDDAQLDVPDLLIRSEMEDTFHRFVHRLETQEISLEDYLGVTGQTQEAFLDDLRKQAERNLRTRIVLEAVANQEEMQVAPEELAATIEMLARSSEQPDQVRKALSDRSRALSVVGDILRNKALEVVVAAARAVDKDGNPVDLDLRDPGIGADIASDEVEAQVVDAEEFEAEVVDAEIIDEES